MCPPALRDAPRDEVFPQPEGNRRRELVEASQAPGSLLSPVARAVERVLGVGGSQYPAGAVRVGQAAQAQQAALSRQDEADIGPHATDTTVGVDSRGHVQV